MSKIEATLKDGILTIEKKTSRQDKRNIEPIQIDILEYGKEYDSKLRVTNPEEKDKVFFLQRVNTITKNISEEEELETSKDENNVIIVYSQNNKIKYSYCSENKAYKKLVKLRFRVLKISLNKKKLKIK